MRQLSRKNSNTFYVAPEFSQLEEFNTSYLSRAITESSRLIRVSDCHDIRDGNQHYITYQAGNPRWIEWSKPKPHNYSDTGKNLEAVYRSAIEKSRPVDLEFAEELYINTKNKVSNDLSTENEKKSRKQKKEEIDLPVLGMLNQKPGNTKQSLLAQASELVSTYYGATMVLVGTKQDV